MDVHGHGDISRRLYFYLFVYLSVFRAEARTNAFSLQTAVLCVSTFLWAFFFFFECLSTSLFIQAVLHSEFVTLDWFCKNMQYVMQYIPKPHNH